MIQLEPRSDRRERRLCDLGPLERARYYGWWRQYTLLKRTATVGGLACCGLALLAYAEPQLGSIAKLFVWPALFTAVGAGLWISFLDCPRCGERFHAGSESPPNDECQNCGLTHRELSAVAKPRESSTRF